MRDLDDKAIEGLTNSLKRIERDTAQVRSGPWLDMPRWEKLVLLLRKAEWATEQAGTMKNLDKEEKTTWEELERRACRVRASLIKAF